MIGVQVRLEGGRAAFRPRETARGSLSWSLHDPPRTIELRLFWRTEGKGTQDVSIVWTHRIDDPAAQGSVDFAAPLPDQPYSFSGKLISLVWAFEAVVEPGPEHDRVDIVLAPEGSEVVLGSADGKG